MKIQNIQALRALAALIVVVCHLRSELFHGPTGASGVALFFVISGFTMAQVSTRENVAIFVKKRLIRILPLYWIATLAAFAVSPCQNAGFFFANTPTKMELLKSLLFIPFARKDGFVNPVLPLGWTLNYEMAFYALVAVGILFVGKKASIFAAACIPIAMLVFHFLPGAIAKTYASPVTLEFLAGIVIYHAAPRCIGIAKTHRTALMVMALASVATLLFMERMNSLPITILVAPPASVLVFSAVLLFWSGVDLRWRLVTVLGDSSYMIYILHPFVLAGLQLLSIRFHFLNFHSSATGFVIAIGSVCLLSIWLYYKVELPVLRRLGNFFGTADTTKRPAVVSDLATA